MKLGTTLLAFGVAVAASLTLSDLAAIASPVCLQDSVTDRPQNKHDNPKSSPEETAIKNALKMIAIADDKNAYTKLNKLMTESAWDEFVAGRIGEASMMASPDFGGNKNIADVLKKFDVDVITPNFMSGGGMASEDEFKDWNAELLDALPDDAKRIELLKKLDAAKSSEQGDGDGMMIQIVNVSMYKGDVVSTKVNGDIASVKIKPTLPEMPEAEVRMGVQIAEQFPGDEIPEGAEIQDFIPGGGELPDGFEFVGPGGMDFPPVTVKFRKIDGKWKCDGFEMEDFNQVAHPIIEDPAFEGTTVEGDEIRLADYRGKVVLIDFWGTWCKGCIAEFPKLKKMANALEGEDFAIVGIAQDSKINLENFLAKKPLPWINVVDSGQICTNFKVNMFPTTILIDKQGNHVASNLHGKELVSELTKLLELDDDKKEKLSKALKKKMKPQQADF